MYRKNTIKIRSEQKDYKLCIEKMLEFIHLIPDLDIFEKENLNTKDYTNTQFISWLEKHLPKEYNILFEFQKYVSRMEEELDPQKEK